ncbi:HTH-type transcriptional activator IlvY [Psychromonas sp. Urea-02u-13]|uniref:HTH-type transcriptional activator IlvY n=1 Tax=Psychromonas sp. Urea-02u-13 TaxID=2058326 RepID=UPI000C32D06B|nr:HTH-type transcriptional activator IlvY [Psychromonas sp. Urea-02u-13]PKG37212.1 HTH-type transcriptional activator IlvY [Psychromonas sp. Urea-02u-13]
MDIKSLKLFLHLSHSLHFSKTAQAKHVSPSTLSRCIQRIEDELGVALLVRDNRSVVLTDAGNLFKQYALKQIDQWEVLKRELKESKSELEGQINLFCSVTAAYSHLPPILDRFRQLHPKIEIKLNTGDSAIAVDQVLQEQVDFAITAYPDSFPAGLHFKKLAEIPLSIIAPSIACALTAEVNQQSVNWKTIPFILPEHGAVRRRFDNWFRKFKVGKPHIYATVAGHEALISMVALGCGVGIAPDVVIENSPVRDRVQEISSESSIQSFDLGVCCNKKRLQEPLIHAFISCVET